MEQVNFQNTMVSKSATILDAVKKLELNKRKFLIVVDSKKNVIGTLVDGDVRRSLLNNHVLSESVSGIVLDKFEYITEDSKFHEVCDKFKSEKIEFLPIVDKSMKLVNIITKKQFHIVLLENVKFDLTCDFEKFDHHVLEHEVYNRPWGFYKSTVLTSHAQAKIITVFPEGELSLQEHKKREEHWVVIKGKGKVILGESILEASPGKYFFIPKGCKHKVINDGSENFVFSEVQLGDYFGEDDIVRYSDKYGRK